MRNFKELGEVLLENQDLFQSGLCHWIDNLKDDNKITKEERDKLKIKIDYNRPTRKIINIIYNPDKIKHYQNSYYWKRDEIKPRIKWIKKHLINEKQEL